MADIGTLTITLGVDDSGLLAAKTRVNDFVKDIQNKVPKITPALTQPFEVFSKQAIGHIALVSQRIRTFGYLASATITAPMTLAGKAVMSMAKDYEFAIQKIVGLTGTAQSVVNGWSKDIQNMAKEFGRNPKELAEGLYFIASSGIQGAQALDVLNKSAKAAAAGLGTTQEVANYLTSVLNAYRGTGLTAAYATDVLVAAVREGKAEASGFAAAMGSLTPIASNLGVSIDQVAGAMAGITLTGSTAAQAATYLRGVFNVLMKETKQGSVAMDEASEALGQMKTSYGDLRKILREQGIMALMQKLNELSAAYGETLVSKVFPNIRAMLGVLSLSGKNMKYNSEIMKEITNSSGALGKAFAAVADTIKLRYDKAIAGMQTSMISLGKQIAEGLIPVLEWLTRVLDKVAKWFDSLTEAQQKSVIKWGLIVAAAGPVALIFSTLGYVLTGLLNTLNGVGKVLIWFSQVVTGTRVAVIAAEAATISWSARLVTLGKTLKTLIAFFATNPFGIVIAGLSIGIGVMIKKIREVKAEIKTMEEALTFTTPEMELDTKIGDIVYKQIEGTNKYISNLKNLNEEELRGVQNMIDERISLEESKYNKILAAQKDGIKNDEFILKQKQIIWEKEEYIWNLTHRNNPHWEENRVAIVGAKKEIEAANAAINSYTAAMSYDKTSAESNLKYYRTLREEIQKLLKVTEETAEQMKKQAELDEKISAIQKDLKVGKLSIERLIDWGDGSDVDKAKAFFELYDGIVKRIAETPELSIKVPWVKQTIDDWKKWKGVVEGSVSAIQKLKDSLDADLSSIQLHKFIDPSFDDTSAKFEAYKKNYESLIELVTKSAGKTSLFGIAAGADIVAQVAIIRKAYRDLQLWNEQKEKAEDNKMLNILQSEADAFGGLAGKIEVVSYALQAAQRDLRDMFTKKEEKGVILDERAVQKTVDDIKRLKIELVDLQNAQELTWLTDMNNALDTAATNSELLSGKISTLENKLQSMSENGQGSTEMFKSMAKQLQTLTNAQTATDLLADAFTDMFQSIMEGGKDMQQVLSGILKSIINELMAALARLLAMKIIMAIIAPAKVGGFMKSVSPTSFLSMQTGRFAKGGVVPRGYPNDSYPALLSSGEVVLPKNVADSLSSRNDSSEGGEVVFRIEQDALVGILKKANKKNSLY